MDWHGRPRQGFWGEDERVLSHMLKLSSSLFLSISLSLFLSLPPPLCLLQDGLLIFATWVLTRVHMQIQSRTCINTNPHMQIFEQHLTILIQFKSTYKKCLFLFRFLKLSIPNAKHIAFSLVFVLYNHLDLLHLSCSDPVTPSNSPPHPLQGC